MITNMRGMIMNLTFSLNIRSHTRQIVQLFLFSAFDIFVRIEPIYANVQTNWKRERDMDRAHLNWKEQMWPNHTAPRHTKPKSNFHIIWNSWEIKIKFHSKLLSIFLLAFLLVCGCVHYSIVPWLIWPHIYPARTCTLFTWLTFFYAVGAWVAHCFWRNFSGTVNLIYKYKHTHSHTHT